MTGPAIENALHRARANAAKGLAVMRADGQCLLLPKLPRDSVDPKRIAAMEKMLPSTTPRNVAVIADVAWAASGEASLQVASKAIPFLGLLMGLSSIGHSIWIFQGSADQLS